jgi:ppGpp synthetase/RelA/SpoT-type nucleotidyltranferase
MDTNTYLIVEEYKNKIVLYEEFCRAIYGLVESLLKENHYKYQIAYRIKDLNSLEKKIELKHKNGHEYKKLSDIEDLAGIRIIFYIEPDRKRFIKNILKELSSKIKVEETNKDTGYSAIHLIAGLGPKRSKLIEYKKFKGLKCEIQLSLILEHAWSEIEHDLFYKQDESIKNMDKKNATVLRGRLKGVLVNYISKASSEFEKIIKRSKRKEN